MISKDDSFCFLSKLITKPGSADLQETKPTRGLDMRRRVKPEVRVNSGTRERITLAPIMTIDSDP